MDAITTGNDKNALKLNTKMSAYLCLVQIYKYKASKSYNYKNMEQFIVECMQSLTLTKISFTRPPSCYTVLLSRDLIYHVILYIT